MELFDPFNPEFQHDGRDPMTAELENHKDDTVWMSLVGLLGCIFRLHSKPGCRMPISGLK